MMFGQFEELNRLTGGGPGHRYSEAEAQAVALELIRPLTADRAAAQTLAHWLARTQLNWQDGRIHALDAGRLLAGVNRELGLENSPDLLLVDDELRKTREFLRSRAPGLIGEDTALQMGPFEAFFTIGQLVRFKMAGAPIPQAGLPAQPVRAKLTLVARPHPPVDHPFLMRVIEARQKWPTVAAGQATLEKVLAESQ